MKSAYSKQNTIFARLTTSIYNFWWKIDEPTPVRAAALSPVYTR